MMKQKFPEWKAPKRDDVQMRKAGQNVGLGLEGRGVRAMALESDDLRREEDTIVFPRRNSVDAAVGAVPNAIHEVIAVLGEDFVQERSARFVLDRH
jgi:hypothetical protein